MTSPSTALAALEKEAVPPFEHLDLVTVRIPFITPFSISSATWDCKEALLLRLSSGTVTAWGECVADPDPYYAPETTVSAAHVIKRFLIPLVEPGMPFGEFSLRLKRVRGNSMAKATLENALIDLLARRQQVSLGTLLGGSRTKIPSGISLGLQESPNQLVREVETAVARGYHRVKIKVKKGKDLEYIRAVRERFPGIQLMADANGDYTLEDARHLSRFDEFSLMMIEQPLSYSDFYEHSLLQAKLTTPICLDESIHSLEDARSAIALGGCRILNLKQGRVGGLLESLRILELAISSRVPVWSGGMDESGIGRAVNIHLQTVDGFTLPGDTSETSRYFHEDIVDPPVVLDPDGYIDVPHGPGSGVSVVLSRLEKYTVEKERVV